MGGRKRRAADERDAHLVLADWLGAGEIVVVVLDVFRRPVVRRVGDAAAGHTTVGIGGGWRRRGGAARDRLIRLRWRPGAAGPRLACRRRPLLHAFISSRAGGSGSRGESGLHGLRFI